MIVADNGIGISADFLPHIFEQFERERNTTAVGIEGTGLGMSIVKHLVELLDGTIVVTSERGRGTTVTVTTPHRKVTTPGTADATSAPAPSFRSRVGVCFSRKTIPSTPKLRSPSSRCPASTWM